MATNITVIWNKIVSFLMIKQKTRDLPIYDFLEILQIEYITAELRSKIYPNLNDKAYYKDRVMPGKRSKIEDICSRNPALPNIFNNKEERKRIIEQVYGSWGLPDFHYKDEQHKQDFSLQDFNNYFMQGSDVRVKVDTDVAKIGVLEKVDRKNHIAIVKLRGEDTRRKVSLNNVARIL